MIGIGEQGSGEGENVERCVELTLAIRGRDFEEEV